MEIKKDNDFPVVVKPLQDSPALQAGIKAGDRIIQIDEKPVKNLELHRISALLRGPLKSVARIHITRNGIQEPIILDIKREVIKLKNIQYNWYEPDLCYIKLSQFEVKIIRNINDRKNMVIY